MNRKLPLLATLGALLTLLTSTANAVLIEIEASTITRDTRTGLEWLDLSATDGWSINQANSSDYVTNDGFRVANASEVDSLLESAGLAADVFNSNQVAPESFSWTSLPVANPNNNIQARLTYEVLKTYLGITHRFSFQGASSERVSGIFLGESGPGSLGSNDNVSSAFKGVGGVTLNYDTHWDAISFSGNDEQYGVYLVRDSTIQVNEPSILMLLLVGLALGLRKKCIRFHKPNTKLV